MTGIEPFLIKTLCEGIRQQGGCMGDDSTAELCRPLIPILLDRGADQESRVEAAFDYLKQIASSPSCLRSNASLHSSLDFGKLVEYVQGHSEHHQLVESPTACLERYLNRVLVLPTEFAIPKRQAKDE